MSAELDILTELETALKAVLVANGFQTDAGASVFKNLEYETQPEDSIWPCTIYFPQALQSGLEGETPPCQGEQNNFLPVLVEGFIKDDERGTNGQALKEDLLKTLVAAGTFGGWVEKVENYSSQAEVKSSSEGYWSYVSASFTLFYVTPWGEI